MPFEKTTVSIFIAAEVVDVTAAASVTATPAVWATLVVPLTPRVMVPSKVVAVLVVY